MNPTRMNVQQLVDWIDRSLAQVVENAHQIEVERQLLLFHFLGASNLADLSAINPPEPSLLGLMNALEARIQQKKPLAYIVGEAWFYDLPYFIQSEEREKAHSESYTTYVPRLETEELVRRALAFCKQQSVQSVLDVATGSGCIPISIKKYYPAAQVTAIEISEDALSVARRNAARHQTPIRFIQGSWFDPVQHEKFDLILCNPPYVPKGAEQDLSPDARFEPRQAHYPQESPEELYIKLLRHVKACLNPKGAYLFEMGFGQFGSQSFDVVKEANQLGLSAEIKPDYTGVDRFLVGTHQP